MKLFRLFLGAILLNNFFVLNAWAQETPPLYEDEYFLGEVNEVIEEGLSEIIGEDRMVQTIEVGLPDGTTVRMNQDYSNFDQQSRRVDVGDQVVVLRNRELDNVFYFVADKYRTPGMVSLLVGFFVLTMVFAGFRGLTALLGLGFNILVIIYFIIPRIVAGDSPLMICLLGGIVIAVVSLYCAHGLNKRASIALGSTLITLFIAVFLAQLMVDWSSLSGTGTEEAFFLQFGELAQVNLRGLLLGGIIIGALGVLDDVTTTQAAAVDELKKANSSLDFGELYRRGISIGREHITSLVNTLALAYAGASLPLLLIFSISTQPLWVVLNSEFIAEELVRTLVGSTALILAVPITTVIAAYYFCHHPATGLKGHQHG